MNAPIPNALCEAAAFYASQGWQVFPLHWPKIGLAGSTCSCGKSDCSSVGKHPITERGLKDATTDQAQVRRWWQQYPAANVGVVTGAASGIVVLDVDAKDGGLDSLVNLLDDHGQFEPTPEAATGGGGTHYVFAHPGGTVRNSASKIGPGLDVRGDGGYIVAPPSRHASEQRYCWVRGREPSRCKPVAPPDWLREMMVDKPRPAIPPPVTVADSGRHWLGKALARATIGNRNETGYWLACQLRDARMSESEAAGVMRDYVARCPVGDHAYTEREALETLKSAYSSPAREPAKGPYCPQHQGHKPLSAQVPKNGAAAELGAYLKSVADGIVYPVPFPWQWCSLGTQANLPGSITVVCGDPSVGKTFWVLQCVQFWYANGIEPAVFFVEKDRKFHMLRLLAQLERDGRYVDYDWLKNNAVAVEAAMQRHGPFIDALGECIWSQPTERVTLDSLLGWIRDMARAAKRVIVIDPITAVAAGADRWTKDDDFVIRANSILTAHGVSLVLVTHPKKGNRPGQATGHDMAGGAAYYRFADTTIWLKRARKVRSVQYQGSVGIGMAKTAHFFELHKTRNGRGGGWELACQFGRDLKFDELGVVQKEYKNADEDMP